MRASAGPTFRASGFTLAEILIVLSLLVLLASLAWPEFSGRIQASELPDSVDRLRSALYMARSEAVLEHRRFRVRFLTEEQQAVIEWESDPILYPGKFEPSVEPWVNEPVLLGDVQVHEVTIGRPVWTKALAIRDNPDEMAKEEEKRLAQDEEEKRQRDEFLRGAKMNDGEEEDERRPMIVFEVDGSTDWAVLIVSRVRPEDELEETAEQVWLVLDGRTGLAYVREKVTQEQLKNPLFYVDRKKLEPPDTADLDNLTFTIGDQLKAGGELSPGDLLPGQDLTGGEPTDLSGTFAGTPPAQADAGEGPAGVQGEPPPGGEGADDALTGNRGGDRSSGARSGGNPQGNRPQGGGQRGSAGGGSRNPSQSVDDSDLTPEEKERMKKWLDGNH